VRKIILVGVLGIAAGLLLGFAYGHMQLTGEREAHQTKLREMARRLSQVQRRYMEERTLQASLEDEKQAVAGRLDAAQKEKEGLVSENGQLKAKADALEAGASASEKRVASLEAKTASTEAKNGQIEERLAKAEADRAALGQKERQTFQTLQEREKELRQLTEESHRQYDRCAEHNARLCTIAGDLIRKYESKGVVKTLLTNEPFTQIKKVELEKLVQEYKDKIDKEKLRSQ
jgi:chromosome segregation ATPase